MLGAFDGSLISSIKAADLLGMKIDQANAVSGGDLDKLRNVLDKALDSGGLALVHVDNNGNTVGDHWLMVHSRLQGDFIAADPASFGNSTFSRETLAGDSPKKKKHYVILEAKAIYNKEKSK